MNVERIILGIQPYSVFVSERTNTLFILPFLWQSCMLSQIYHESFSACDCKPEGTEDPSCDAETGECLCRVGVTGILCDKCAAGYNSVFPACEECHPCTALWAKHVIDVQRAAKRMKTFIPHQSNSLLSGDYRQQIHRMYSNLDNFVNLIELSPPKVEKLEKLYMKIR